MRQGFLFHLGDILLHRADRLRSSRFFVIGLVLVAHDAGEPIRMYRCREVVSGGRIEGLYVDLLESEVVLANVD